MRKSEQNMMRNDLEIDSMNLFVKLSEEGIIESRIIKESNAVDIKTGLKIELSIVTIKYRFRRFTFRVEATLSPDTKMYITYTPELSFIEIAGDDSEFEKLDEVDKMELASFTKFTDAAEAINGGIDLTYMIHFNSVVVIPANMGPDDRLRVMEIIESRNIYVTDKVARNNTDHDLLGYCSVMFYTDY